MRILTVTGQLRQKKKICTIIIEYNDEQWHFFYCNDCRNPVFQYKGDVIKTIPGLSVSTTPILNMCSNNQCQKIYNIVWMVYNGV